MLERVGISAEFLNIVHTNKNSLEKQFSTINHVQLNLIFTSI